MSPGPGLADEIDIVSLPLTTLFLAPQVPWPLDVGSKIRTWNLLKSYAELGPVTLVCYAQDEKEVAAAEALRGSVAALHVIRLTPMPGSGGPLAQALHRWPRIIRYFTRAEFSRTVNEVSAAQRFDIVHVERLFMAEGIAGLAPSRALRVLDVDDLESAKARRDLDAMSWRKPRKWLQTLDYLKLRAYESRTLRRFDQALVCSDLDRAALARRMVSGKAVTYRNGAELDATVRPATDDGRTLLFFGALDYGPNVDAALFLVREIWPRIRAAFPGVRLRIAGKSPCDEVRALHNGDDVQVTGYVSDKAELFASVTATVVPIRSGGGTRIKILEAMASGKAVVSTRVGCEGIDATDGENILFGDSAEEFAQACLRLLRDAPLRERLALAGRELVSRHYDWSSIRRDFVARLRDAAAVQRPSMAQVAGSAPLPVR